MIKSLVNYDLIIYPLLKKIDELDPIMKECLLFKAMEANHFRADILEVYEMLDDLFPELKDDPQYKDNRLRFYWPIYLAIIKHYKGT